MHNHPLMTRSEWKFRAKELAARGQDKAQAKLTDLDVIEIRSKQRQRMSLEKYIRENLSPEAVAKMYGISLTNERRIRKYETWRHLV